MRQIHKAPFIHPILIGIFPVLSLLAHNAREVPLLSGLRALFIVMLGIVFVYFCLLLILKDNIKASLITSLGSSIFFFYGHLYSELRTLPLLGAILGRHRILAVSSLLVLSFGIIFIIKRSKFNSETILSLNLIGLVLVFIPVFQISQLQFNRFLLQKNRDKERTELENMSDSELPDIYYIIFDGYPRDDILATTFNYDNSDFLQWLKEQGFYVARCSQSNYSYTAPSIASTLNLTYLGNQKTPNRIIFSEDELNAMLQNSLVQETVTQLGYTTITFETEYDWLKWDNPDILFSIKTDTSIRNIFLSKINGFELLLLDTSFASIILDQIELNSWIKESIRQTHQKEIVYALEKLLEVPNEIDGPKFIYAHIVSPHPPYIFGADGELLVNEPLDRLVAYRDQIIFLNTKIQEFISIAFGEAETKPIIIIQGDHGATIDYKKWNIDPVEKLAILNAYYFPNMENEDGFYPEISPVNTFRLLFNQYFSTDYKMLEDLSILGGESPFQRLPCSESRLIN